MGDRDIMSQQREERCNEILVFIVDESYGREHEYVDPTRFEDEIAWVSAASQKYRGGLVEELSEPFERVNVGPGADLPAFVVVISEKVFPLIPWLMAVFFSGKPIVDNLDAWPEILKRISPFYSRQVLLNRQGAAVLAFNAVLDEMEGIPKTVRLISYRNGYCYDEEEFIVGCDGRIDDAPSTLNLGLIKHIFDIEADGVIFGVTVDGKRVTIRRRQF